MRSGWQIARLEDVCKFENGDRGKNYPGRKAFVEKGIPFINAGHLTDGGIDIANMDFISEERFNLLSNGKVRNGDLLFCLRGSLGKFAVVEGIKEGAIASSLVIVRPRDRLNKYYLAAYFRSSFCSSMIEKFRNGAAQPNLSAKSLGQFEIPIPPLPEQKRIVAILDEAFEGIDRAIANTEKNLANAREMFESYLNSIFTEKSERWAEKRLEDTVEETCSLSYGIVQPGEDVDGGLPIVRPTDLKTQYIYLDGLKRINPALAEGYRRTTLSGGELLLCVRGSTGSVAIAAEELAGSNVTRGIVPIRFNRAIVLQDYGYFAFRSKVVQDQVKAATYGAALMQINIRDLRKINLGFPPLDVQKGFLKTFGNLLIEVERLASIYERKFALLAALKQAILQKAFAGELTARSVEDLQEAAQ